MKPRTAEQAKRIQVQQEAPGKSLALVNKLIGNRFDNVIPNRTGVPLKLENIPGVPAVRPYEPNWTYGSNYGAPPATTTVQGNANPNQRLIENNSYIDAEYSDVVERPAITQDKNRIEYSPNTQRGAPRPNEVPLTEGTRALPPPTASNNLPATVETTSAKTPTRTPRGTAVKGGVGILSAINANQPIKEAFENESIVPLAKYGLNLATGGVSGEIERAYNEGAFESAPNANPFGAAWDVTKALVNPMSYWNLAKDIVTGTAENAEDIYNNFADYAWRDTHQKPVENVDKLVENIATPYNYRTWENSSLPQGSPTVAPTSQASPFDSSPENYYKLVNSGKLGNGKDRLKNWIALGGDEASYQAGQKYLNGMYAKSYAKNKVNEKVNTSTAPRPTSQEVRARKAQQDEMLRQSMLNTAQNPNSSVRRNMPDYFNSSTTLQNYYLNNPDLWGRR